MSAILESVKKTVKEEGNIVFEKFILKEVGMNYYQEILNKYVKERKEYCGRTLCKGKFCKTCNKTFCETCFDQNSHNGHEIENVEEIGICWCGNVLDGYCGCEVHNGEMEMTNEESQINDNIKVLIQNLFDCFVEMIHDYKQYNDLICIFLKTVLKFIQNEKICSFVVEHLKNGQLQQLCSCFGDLLKLKEDLIFLKYYQFLIEVLLMNKNSLSLLYNLIDNNTIPIKFIHLFSSPFVGKPINLIQCELLLKTIIQQLQFQITEESFRHQHKMAIRRFQSSFHSNIKLLPETICFMNHNLLLLFASVIFKLNILLATEIQFKTKMISQMVLNQYLKSMAQIFWEIIDGLSNEQVNVLTEMLLSYVKNNINVFQTNKHCFDILIGLLLIEFEKRKMSNDNFNMICPHCLKTSLFRLASFEQFIPKFDFDYEFGKYPLGNNPNIPFETQISNSFANCVHYQFSIAKIASIFELLRYELKTNGLKSFLKICKDNQINEPFIYQIFLYCIHFDPISPHFIQSTIDIIHLTTNNVQLYSNESMAAIALNGSFSITISIDLFNPIALLIPQREKQEIFNKYLMLCYAYDFPIFCGNGIEGWKKDIICDQNILVNLNAVISRNAELTYLLIELLWLRTNSHCVVQSHAVNKRISIILNVFSNQNILCSNTVWRLISEHSSVDSNLVEEFYKINSTIKAK